MKLGRLVLAILLSFMLVFSLVPLVSADQTSDLILQLLVKKGIVTQEEVDDLRTQIAQVQPEKPVEAKKPTDFNVYWKDGLRMGTEDKKFNIEIGGRAYADFAWMQEESPMIRRFGELKDSAEFRAARLYTAGTVYENFIYKLEMDFAGGDADFKDVYIGMKKIPYLGTLKVGHFKEQFSLEELTSSRFITFMERALPNAFVPGRNLGVQINSNAFDERVTWAIGVFRDANDYGNAVSNEWSATARATGLPFYEDKGEKLVHLGVAYSLRNPQRTVQYSARPEAHLANTFVNTGAVATDVVNLLGLESALVWGPFSLQGELNQSFVGVTNAGSKYLNGFYGQASYFLTGEHRNYKKSAAAFDRVKPKNNFSFKNKTWGAWEIAARYSYLNLSAYDTINGGVMNDITTGLNWYLNPNMRIMLDYIHSHRNGVGNADIVESRFQVDF